MLRKVPMVTIDGNENILVKGNSDYKIYKNGHLDPSLSKNAKEILKAMPANSVKRIEVITDPGAREDAEGVNAILNIVMMDTRKMDGVTGSIRGNYSSLNSVGVGTYLATQLGKTIVSIDYGYNCMTKKSTASDGYVERTFVESGNTQKVSQTSSNPGYIHYADINASYDIDTLNLLSASFGGYFYKIDVQGDNSMTMLNAANSPLYHYNDHFWLPSYNHHSWNGRLDYEHKTHRRGEMLTLSYMLALTRQHSEQEDTYSNMQNVPFNYTGFLLKTREHFTEHTFQTDYNSDKWSARAGLRYEFSYMKGHYPLGDSGDFSKRLNDWVPQASVKYQITDRHSLKLGYTTSISRPGISYLNPAVVNSPNRVDFGNARLVSASTHAVSLTYMYVGTRLTLQIVPQYQFSNNAVGSVVYALNDIRHGTYGNVMRYRRMQVEGYAQWKPFNGTTFVANLNYRYVVHKNPDLNLQLTCHPLSYYFYVSQRLPWKLLATAYTYGQMGHSHVDVYSYNRSWNRYAFTLQRSFLSEDRLTVRVMANSPFHKNQHSRTRTVQGDILGWGDNTRNENGRYFLLAFTYRFGKLKACVKKTETTIENSDEVGGISRGK